MKKGIIIILIAVMLGGGFAYYLFNNIVVKEKDTDKTMVNAFQVGAFTSYDNAVRVAERDNGIVVKDEDIFRVYVAILYDKEAVNKLGDYYNKIGLNYYLKPIYVSNSFIEEIKDNEELLKVSSTETYVTINSDVLSKYEEML
ncbi:MAG TPA: hypothetical protein IAC02_10135 [Candidatus Coprovivens excrementavium]|nr:hypothetical protein [Candidatus Coprovivens excrementavium]